MYPTRSRAMNCSKSPVVTELEYMEPLCSVFESGSTTIISFDRLRHMDFMGPLFGTDGETVQSIDHRIAPGLFQGITWRKEHKHLAIDRVSFQIAFQRSPVNFDMLDR